MEIRDVIPSQNQIAIQKNVEIPNRRFRDLMNRKFSDLNQKQDYKSASQSRQEFKSSSEAKKAQSPVQSLANNKSSGSEVSQKDKELSQVSSECDAPEINEEKVKEETRQEESASVAQPVETSAQVAMICPPATVDNQQIEGDEEEAVSLRTENEKMLYDGSVGEMKETFAGRVVVFETDRANLKQLYEVHNASSEMTDYAEMLEVLSSSSKEAVEVMGKVSLFEDDEIGREQLASDVEGFSEISEGSVERSVTDFEEEELNAMTKNEDSSKHIEDTKNFKVQSANDKNVSEPKALKKEQQTFSSGQFFGKTESVLHHDNMVSATPRMVMKQVAEAINVDVKVLSDGRALEVKLSPEHLGKVIMKIEMKEGQMVANIKVENPEVKSALEASIQELRETLSARGVSVKEINVSVSKDEHRGGQEYTGDNRKKDGDEEETKDFRSVLAGEE